MRSLIILFSFNLILQQDFQEFKSEKYGFSLKYPVGWEIQDVGKGEAFVRPSENSAEEFRENVNILIQDIGKFTLDQYAERTYKSTVKTFGEKSIISFNKDYYLLGQKSNEFVFYMDIQGYKLKVKQYWFVKNQKAYLFTYTADVKKYIKYEEIAKRIIDSFVIL